MKTFSLLHIDSQLYRQNEFVHHYFDAQLSARYDSNFLAFKQLPNLTQYQLYELYLTSFHSLNGMAHIKFIWPENEELSEVVSSYLISKKYTITKLYLYTMNSTHYPTTSTSVAKIQTVTDQTMTFYLHAQQEESLRYGSIFAEQKTYLLRKLIRSPRHKIYTATVDSQLVGSITVHLNNRGIELDDFYVLDMFQRQGIGSALLSAIVADFPNTYMMLVTDAADTAKEMYEKLGFVNDGFRIEFLKTF